ncbi:MAG: tetratricopeptide repeat protein [bacterium]|nr:tetratricopeptide repeat protein [bacterium]
MLTDWIFLGVFGACVVTCAVVVWRKLPQLASIRTDAIPKHQQQARKQQILDKRLQQKLGNAEAAIVRTLTKGFQGMWSGLQVLLRRLRELEREYRRKVVTQQSIENPEVLRSRLATGLADAQTAMAAEDFPRAEQLFVDIVALDPKNVEAYIGLADVAMAKKDYTNAREALQFVLKLQQGNDSVYTRLGRIATDEGKFSEAEADYLKSVSLNASTATAQFELANIEVKLGNVEKAQTAFQEAVKLEPANPKYLDALLAFAIQHTRKDIARETLARLREANPENQKLPELAEAVKKL